VAHCRGVTDQDIADAIGRRLGGRPVPDDLRRMIGLQESGTAGTPLDTLEATVVAPGHPHPLLDFDYLNGQDRADPDIMANVAAMAEVLSHMLVVVHAWDDSLFGYWLHPDETASTPPLVQLDSEGQFSTLPGRTLAEAMLAAKAGFDDEWFARLAERFTAVGVTVAARSREDLERNAAVTPPEILHERLYEQERERRGL
jgi:hypothetical protein